MCRRRNVLKIANLHIPIVKITIKDEIRFLNLSFPVFVFLYFCGFDRVWFVKRIVTVSLLFHLFLSARYLINEAVSYPARFQTNLTHVSPYQVVDLLYRETIDTSRSFRRFSTFGGWYQRFISK